ncbi:MAG: acyltransferase [Acidimicrobiales bacterium]|nr:acyltransferase [Acidimicrobiales bacterium]
MTDSDREPSDDAPPVTTAPADGEPDAGGEAEMDGVDEITVAAATLFDQDAWEPVVEAPVPRDEDEEAPVLVAAAVSVDGPTLFDQDATPHGREVVAIADREDPDLDDPALQPQADLAHVATAGATVAAAPKVHIRYEPALDGLRGLAVLGVLFFHGQFAWARGGFLGVSTFFTLSGFLITTLLVTEHHGRGTISLRNFWTRRFRRLMPASVVVLAGISVLFGLFVADAAQLNDLRGDVLAALFYVANWHFIVADQSYADLFTAPSPVQHFWSLAIEEQFYVVYPLLVFGVLKVAKGARRVLFAVLLGLTVASLAWMLHLYEPGLDTARVYYSTFTRAAELLIGGLLALVLVGRGPLRRPGAVLAAGAAGVLALGATVWCWLNIDQSDGVLYQGGLVVYAGFSALLILAALQVAGPVQAIFSKSGIVALGKISYGVYLIHWPIFLWLTPERTGLALWPLFALRMAVTLGLAVVSYWYLEQPVRQRILLVSKRSWVVAPAAVTAVVMAVVLVTLSPPTVPNADFAEATRAIEAPETSPEALAAQADAVADAVPVAATTAPNVDRVLLVGDSVMGQAYPFFRDRFAERGITTGYAGGPGTGPLNPQGEGDWLSQIDRWVADFDPDVVVIEACCDYTNPPDELYRLPDGTEVLPNTDLAYQAWEQVSREMIRRASARGARVFWVISPPVKTNGYYGPMEDHVARLNEIYRSFAVPKIDWATPSSLNGEYSDDLPIGPDGEMVRVRADDGLHYTPEGDLLLADATLRTMLQLEARPGF